MDPQTQTDLQVQVDLLSGETLAQSPKNNDRDLENELEQLRRTTAPMTDDLAKTVRELRKHLPLETEAKFEMDHTQSDKIDGLESSLNHERFNFSLKTEEQGNEIQALRDMVETSPHQFAGLSQTHVDHIHKLREQKETELKNIQDEFNCELERQYTQILDQAARIKQLRDESNDVSVSKSGDYEYLVKSLVESRNGEDSHGGEIDFAMAEALDQLGEYGTFLEKAFTQMKEVELLKVRPLETQSKTTQVPTDQQKKQKDAEAALKSEFEALQLKVSTLMTADSDLESTHVDQAEQTERLEAEIAETQEAQLQRLKVEVDEIIKLFQSIESMLGL